ncbi:hypothetical protein L3X38_025379 [Prunus dulcis]|uniref:Uncharacterized protein n=1 Tax=Prunus dulcis TaxID=3755 RepID=A0AAD4W2D7_PRUDU|nr:hypothetical protein L3X38_025379 [Prunus dulcis]
MWPLPQYDSSIGPSRVESPSNAEPASSDLKSELVARHKSNLLVALSVVPPKHEKDHKCISRASRHETHRATEKDLKAGQVCKLQGLHAPQSLKGPAPNFPKTRDKSFGIPDITPMPGPLTKDRDSLPKFRQSLPYKLDISQNFNLHKNTIYTPNWQHAQYNFMQFI